MRPRYLHAVLAGATALAIAAAAPAQAAGGPEQPDLTIPDAGAGRAHLPKNIAELADGIGQTAAAKAAAKAQAAAGARSRPTTAEEAKAAVKAKVQALAKAKAAPQPRATAGQQTRRSNVSPSLAGARGQISAFVELEAKAGVDLAKGGASAASVRANDAKVRTLAEQVVPRVARSGDRTTDEPQRISVTTAVVPGIVIRGDAAEIRALAGRSDVKSVYQITPKRLAAKNTDALTKATSAWTSAGLTGKGVRIGVIDTGLDYTHADFGGPGTPAAYTKAYGAKGTGSVPAGTYDATKYLGGYDFAGYDYEAGVPGMVPVPDNNPIDPRGEASFTVGHGTHTAGSAVGFGVTAAGKTFRGDYRTLTNVAGMKIGPGSAPQAGIYALKVFGDQGMSTDLAINALEWAADPNHDGNYADHLDIVSLSLGSDFAPADDPECLFVDKLAAIGTLSVISSGNGGDATDVGGSPGSARSALTVANTDSGAETHDGIKVTAPAAKVGTYPATNSTGYEGADVTAPVAYLGDGFTGCKAYTAAQAAQVKNKLVYLAYPSDEEYPACFDDDTWDDDRFVFAKNAGALGIVGGADAMDLDNLFSDLLPATTLLTSTEKALLPTIKAGTMTAQVGPSLLVSTSTVNSTRRDTLDYMSSRGVHGSLGIIKPDVAAPGVEIYSALSGGATDGQFLTGTSMAAPHVAGIAALVHQAHPKWTAQQVKAAVMNTAIHDVYSYDSWNGVRGGKVGPLRAGAGRVNALGAVQNTTLAYATGDPKLVSVTFGVVPVADKTVTQTKQVTVQNLGTKAATYTTSFARSTSMGSASITVSPASITVPAGGKATVNVTLKAVPSGLKRAIDPTSDQTWTDYVASISGRLVLTSGSAKLRVPVQAAPRLVSSMKAANATFKRGSATTSVSLTGRGVNSGGWSSLIAPFELKATSGKLSSTAHVGVPGSVLRSGDIRAVGFTSTEPQTKGGKGSTVAIAIAMEGEWTSMPTGVFPAARLDLDNDGKWEVEASVGQIYGPESDTFVATYATRAFKANGVQYSVGDTISVLPYNGLDADIDSTLQDNNVLVLPIPLAPLGISPSKGSIKVQAVTYSRYSEFSSWIFDKSPVFTANPYAPNYYSRGVKQLWYQDTPSTPLTVVRSSTTAVPGTGKLLVLHSHNQGTTNRWQIVPVTQK